MDVKAEEEYADAQKRARENVIAALAPRVPGVYAITVSGSGDPHIFEKEARELGKAIAIAGYDLLTGGLCGVMFDVTQGFLGANSGMKAVGIIPQGKQEKAAKVKAALKQALGKKRIFPISCRCKQICPASCRMETGTTKDRAAVTASSSHSQIRWYSCLEEWAAQPKQS